MILKPTTLSILLSIPLLSFADTLSDSIIGCDQLSCPYDGDYHCNLGRYTYSGVGLARISNVPSSLEGLSLVKAVNMSTHASPGENRTDGLMPAHNVYYLGSPEDLDIGDLTGCAVTFDDAPANSFKASGSNSLESATGACSDIISQKCIDKLTERARNVTRDHSGSNLCSSLENALNGAHFDECRDLGGNGTAIGNFTVASLDNITPITKSKNSVDYVIYTRDQSCDPQLLISR